MRPIEPRQPGGTLLLSAFLCALLTAPAVRSQSAPQILFDLENTAAPRGSNPAAGVELPNGTCVFVATDPTIGRELWVTTPTGPAPLVDLFPGRTGSQPRDLVLFQGEVYFRASTPVSGSELFKTNGTAAGTVLVADIDPGAPGSAPENLTVCGNLLFFTAFVNGSGREPHVSDGTANGTFLLRDILTGDASSAPDSDTAHPFVCCGNFVFFAADDGTNGVELWRSNGTPAGTIPVADINPNGDGVDASEPMVCHNGRIYFRGEDGATGLELFTSNGTAAGTFRLTDLRAGAASSIPRSLCSHGSELFFSGVSDANGRELFKTDGTPAGTTLVADLLPGTSSSNPLELASCGNLLYFAANSDISAQTEPHVSDGTAAGTRQLLDLNPGFRPSLPDQFTCCGNLVFFAARTLAEGEELFVTNGTAAGTTRLTDLLPGADFSEPAELFCCGSNLLFRANSTVGIELHETDGTVAGTVTHDLDPRISSGNSSPRFFRGVGVQSFFFIATTAATGTEVFFYDGQTATAIEVVAGPDGSTPRELTVVDDTAYWTAVDPVVGRELFRSTAGGPAQLVADIRSGFTGSNPIQLTRFDHQTIVMIARSNAEGEEIVVATNGIPGVQIFDVRPGTSSSFPNNLTKMIDPVTGANFIIFSANDGVTGTELHSFDGTSTVLIRDLEAGSFGSGPRRFAADRDGLELLFEAQQGGNRKIFRLTIDELSDTTYEIEELADLVNSFLVRFLLSPSEFFRLLVNLPLILLMDQSFPNPFGEEPYTLDAQGNPTLIADLNTGTAGSNASEENVGIVRDAWLLEIETLLEGNELGAVDATQGLVIDILEGHESASPHQFVQVGETTYFHAEGQVEGEPVVYELDAETLFPERQFAGEWEDPTLIGLDLVFGFDAPAGGWEPHRFRPSTAIASVVGTSCDGRARTRTTPPIPGQNTAWHSFGGPDNGLGFVVWGEPVGNDPVPFFGCKAWINPNTAITAAAFAGSTNSSVFAIPASQAFNGVIYGVQTVFVDIQGNVIATDAVINQVGQ
ncbi:MAG: hypothetical protein NXI31_20365 [bacterium]|nr:hypothetical protein [bacterium]